MMKLTVALLVVAALACTPEKQDPDNDSFRMTIDGTLVEFEVVAELAQEVQEQKLDELDGLVAFDDRETKRYDDANDIGIYGGELGEFTFGVSMPEEIGTGTLTINRSQLYRAAEPWVRFSRTEDGARNHYFPRNGQAIDVSIAEDGRLAVTFDRIEVVDDCDNPVILEGGAVDGKMLDTVIFEDFPLFADFDIDPRQVEGFSTIVTDQGPFTDLFPLTFAPGGGITSYDLILTNLCPTSTMGNFNVSFEEANQVTPGIYDVADLFVLAGRPAGDPADPTDDDLFLGMAGTIELLSFDEAFLELRITETIDLVHVVIVNDQLELDDTQHMTVDAGGTVKSLIER